MGKNIQWDRLNPAVLLKIILLLNQANYNSSIAIIYVYETQKSRTLQTDVEKLSKTRMGSIHFHWNPGSPLIQGSGDGYMCFGFALSLQWWWALWVAFWQLHTPSQTCPLCSQREMGDCKSQYLVFQEDSREEQGISLNRKAGALGQVSYWPSFTPLPSKPGTSWVLVDILEVSSMKSIM